MTSHPSTSKYFINYYVLELEGLSIIFVWINFYSPWVIEQENPKIGDGYSM